MDRRSFIGAAFAAVVGLVGLGFARKQARDEIKGSKRETVKAPGTVPERLARFNDIAARNSQALVALSASRPPSDLNWTKLGREMHATRIVQNGAGECGWLIPYKVAMNREDGAASAVYLFKPA